MRFVKFIEKDIDNSDGSILIVADTDEAIDSFKLQHIVKNLKEKRKDLNISEIVYLSCEEYFGKRNIPYKNVYATEVEI